jgi:hypothetical protein
MKLSTSQIDKLKPIIDLIDAELEKDQEERLPIILRTTQVRTLKNSLAEYKSNYKRAEWNGRFEMWQRKDHLEINFNVKQVKLQYSIERGVNTPAPDDDKYDIVRPSSTVSTAGQGPVKELNDRQITELLLVDNIDEGFFWIPALSDETKTFLSNMKTADPSALINLLMKRSYKISIPNPSVLRIFK